MNSCQRTIRVILGLVAACIVTLPACAGTTDVTNFAKNGNLQSNLDTAFPSGMFGTSAFGGVSFNITSDANGYNLAAFDDAASLTVALNLPGVTDVYTLLNATNPTLNAPSATVVFNATNEVSESFTLVNGIDVRDWFHSIFADTINGTTTQNVFSVTNQGGAGTSNAVQTSNSSTGLTGTYLLDAQHFTLNSAFANQTLTSIVFTTDSGSTQNFLSAITVVSNGTAAPDAPSLPLIALGLTAVTQMGRKRRGWRLRAQ